MDSDDDLSKTEKGKSMSNSIVEIMSDGDRSRLPSTDSLCDLTTERSIKHKFDLHIIPWVFLLWMFAFVDRSNLTNAYMDGLEYAADLTGDRLNTALVVFHILFILVNVPSNLLLKKIGGGVYLPALALGGAIVTTCMGTVESYGALLACRIFLGAFQGGFFAGVVLYLGMFYKRDELMLRFGIFISAASLSGAFGGLLSLGLGQISYGGYNHWPWIFFIEGAVSVVLAIASFLCLPNTPSSARFLLGQERIVAVHRLYLDLQGSATVEDVEEERLTWREIIFGVFNVNTLLISLSNFLITIPVYSFAIFLPLLIRGMGLQNHFAAFEDPTAIQALTIPPNFFAFLSVLTISYTSEQIERRGLLILPALAVAATGYIMQLASSDTMVQYAGTFLIGAGALPATAVLLPWLSSNLAPHYSRATGLGFAAMIGQCGAVVATFTYMPSESPTFTTGHSINLVALGMAAIVVTADMLYIRWENAARRAGKRNYRCKVEREGIEMGFRHPTFRFTT